MYAFRKLHEPACVHLVLMFNHCLHTWWRCIGPQHHWKLEEPLLLHNTLLHAASVCTYYVSDRSAADWTVRTPRPEVHTTRIAHTHVTTLVQNRVCMLVYADQALCVLHWTAEWRRCCVWRRNLKLSTHVWTTETFSTNTMLCGFIITMFPVNT